MADIRIPSRGGPHPLPLDSLTPPRKVRKPHKNYTQAEAHAKRARELGGVTLFRATMREFYKATRPKP